MANPARKPTPAEALILDVEWPDDPFIRQVVEQQLEWFRLVVEVSGLGVAAMIDRDYNTAAEEFARCERLVRMIQESKRWRRIHEQGSASDD